MPLSAKSKAVTSAAVITMATAFIMPWEGKRNEAYLDKIASPHIWTVCYGHTGKYAYQGAKYSDSKCMEILREDVSSHYSGMAKCVKTDQVPVSVQASMLELFFNVGVGAGCNSTMTKLANSGRYWDACRELDRWVKAAGVTVKGLVNRRNASQDMCIKDLPK